MQEEQKQDEQHDKGDQDRLNGWSLILFSSQ